MSFYPYPSPAVGGNLYASGAWNNNPSYPYGTAAGSIFSPGTTQQANVFATGAAVFSPPVSRTSDRLEGIFTADVSKRTDFGTKTSLVRELEGKMDELKRKRRLYSVKFRELNFSILIKLILYPVL